MQPHGLEVPTSLPILHHDGFLAYEWLLKEPRTLIVNGGGGDGEGKQKQKRTWFLQSLLLGCIAEQREALKTAELILTNAPNKLFQVKDSAIRGMSAG